MAQLVPVDFDPFAARGAPPQLVPVDHDPFAGNPAPPVTIGPGLGPNVGVSAPEPTPEQFQKDDADIAARKAAAVPGKGASADAPMMGIADPKTGQLTWSAAPNDVPSALPTIARTADDAARSVANGATFGFVDDAVAGGKALAGNGTYTDNLVAERGRDTAISPFVRIPGEIAGAVATGTGLARGGVTLLNAARPTIANMALRGAGEGAAYGAVSGFGHGTGGIEDRLTDAGYGAGLGALTGGVTGGVAGAMAGRGARAAIPTTEGLRGQANAAYDAADAAGLVVRPDSFRNAVAGIAANVQREGLDRTLHPGATRVLERLGEAVDNGTPLTLQNLETLRRVANGAARDFNNPDQQRLAGMIRDGLDDYMHGLQPGDVAAGDANAATTALGQARDLWSRFRKSDAVDELMRRAEIRASQFSGSGYENALRTEFRALAMNRRRMAGFTPDERGAIEQVARGGPLQNALRMVGKLAPTGVISGGIGTTGGAAIGSALGGPAGAAVGAVAVPALGAAARSGATAMTRNNAQAVSDIVRSGGNLPGGVLTDRQIAALRAGLLGLSEQAPGLLNQTPRAPGLLNQPQPVR